MVNHSEFLDHLGNSYPFKKSDIEFSEENNVQGWCPTQTMCLLNIAVEAMSGNENYLEIGSFCGRSLVGALKYNKTKAIVIDPLNLTTQNGTTEELWFGTINKFKLKDRVTLFKQLAEDFSSELPSIGVFFYDGNHDSGHTYEALRKFSPFLAKSAIIIVDDYDIFGGDQQNVYPGHTLDINRPVKTDTDRWIAENKNHVKMVILTPWLNGQAVIFYEA